MNIDFVTFIGPNSADYADYLKYTCEKFVSGKHNINWKCVESVGAEKLPKGYECILKAPDGHHNSMNHGIALNLASKNVKEDYIVFIDADMAIVYPNWDDIIVNELNKVDCFGVSYDDKIKYRNFPTVYLFAFRKHILDKVELDFRPSVSKGEKPDRKKLTPQECKLCNMPEGSTLKCDTGWKLPIIIRGSGFTSNSMDMVMMTSKNAQLPFENEQHKRLCFLKPGHQYEWHYNGKVFTTHKQASRTQPLNETWGNSWKRRIDLYIDHKEV